MDSQTSLTRITPNITASPQLSTASTPQLSAPQLSAPQLSGPQLSAPQLSTPQLSSPQLTEDDIKNSTSSSGHLPYIKQYELGDEPQRKKFLDTFKDFMEQNGTPCLRVPMADNTNNIPLDLYKLYREVCRRNGMPEV